VSLRARHDDNDAPGKSFRLDARLTTFSCQTSIPGGGTLDLFAEFVYVGATPKSAAAKGVDH
jgi:hypothetical protein